jgi:hypothetical protein
VGAARVLPVTDGRVETDTAIGHLNQPPPGRTKLVIDVLTAAAAALVSRRLELLADVKYALLKLFRQLLYIFGPDELNLHVWFKATFNSCCQAMM